MDYGDISVGLVQLSAMNFGNFSLIKQPIRLIADSVGLDDFPEITILALELASYCRCFFIADLEKIPTELFHNGIEKAN